MSDFSACMQFANNQCIMYLSLYLLYCLLPSALPLGMYRSAKHAQR